LDGNAIIHRAYHALPPLTTKDGTVVNAVYGFSMTLLSVLEKFKPTHVAASFDLSAPTFRHEMSKEYKAKRVKAPDELYAQIPIVKQVVEAFDIPIYEESGYEADDMIGSLAKVAAREGFDVVIVTGDMDTLQLVDDHIKVFTMRRGIKDTVLYDYDGVVKKYGLDPDQLADYKGLAGDASDNIPGVTGIGPKGASDLLQKYTTLEGVYEHIDEVKPALKEKLLRDKAQALQSKDLGTIRTNVIHDFDESACAYAFDDKRRESVRHIFADLNFFSLISRLSGRKASSNHSQKKRVRDKKYEKGEEAFDKAIETAQTKKSVAVIFDKEDRDVPSGVALCVNPGHVVYISWEKGKERLQALLEDKNVIKTFLSAKEAYHIALREQWELRGPVRDVTLMAYILGEGSEISLEHLTLSELGEEADLGSVQDSLFATGSEAVLSPTEEMMCRKSDLTGKIAHSLFQKIQEVSQDQPSGQTLEAVLSRVEMPLVSILASMEQCGVKFDKRVFEGVAEKLTKDISVLEKRIYDCAGEEFNINSTKQLREVLFEKLEIDTSDIKKTKTGYSTASSELQKLKKDYPIASAIEEYRELFKLKTTYVDALPQLVAKDGRLHTTFHQTVASTGRLSSSDPNLQNIPVRTELGRLLRTAFVADDGHVLVSADYSQIDLRCAAHVSADKKMIEAFHKGEDIHTATASEVFGVVPSAVTKGQRQQAKVLNFGVLYGMSSYGFMNAAGVSRSEGQDFIDRYMEKFSGLATYLKETKERAREHGYVETELGRRRYVPEINSANFQVSASGERMAINLPIQGLAADIMKLAMIDVDQFIREKYGDEVSMILQIHDELILEVPEKLEKTFGEEVKSVMEQAHQLKVPLVVDTASGRSWAEL